MLMRGLILGLLTYVMDPSKKSKITVVSLQFYFKNRACLFYNLI